MKQEEKQTSDFGKGFIYNLILFSMHWWRWEKEKEYYKDNEEQGLEFWFNGASDHFYELDIPEQFKNTKIGKLAQKIKDNGLYFGHGFQKKPTQKDFDNIFEDIKKLSILIDKELGIDDIKGTWE